MNSSRSTRDLCWESMTHVKVAKQPRMILEISVGSR